MRILAMIMAGGASQALSVLTSVRSEAAIPFGGKYRIIDFALSNCVNSQIFNVAILTQYMPRSLNDHIGVGKPWDLDRAQGGVRLLQPYLGREIGGWQKGTADAVRQNLDFVEEQRADTVLILAGDHIYKMDYRPMLRFHRETGANVTVGVRRVSPFETHRFGILALDPDQRVVSFREKPRHSHDTLASMGVYIFNYDILRECLTAPDPPFLDFGRDVLPVLVPTGNVFAYTFEGYWADVGTVQAYWEANMALLAETPALDLHDPEWVIHTRSEERPPVKLGPAAQVSGNLLANGCIIDGTVERSVISAGAYVAESAVVRDSVVMHGTTIGPGSKVDRAIIDKDVQIGKNVYIGYGENNTPNRLAPHILNTGLTLIGKGTILPDDLRLGHNVVVSPKTIPAYITSAEIPNGETV
ncbi:MAG: glucose-1-phosphate adenylyltransferase subunit GlgD [Anaerolineae bacterium]